MIRKSGYIVSPAWLAAIAALPLATSFASCEAADPTFEGGEFVVVENDADRPIFVAANNGGEYGSEVLVPPRQEDELDWPGCETLNLILRLPPKGRPTVGLPREKYREVLRDEIEMCSGDRLIVDQERNLTVECGETSRHEREDVCGGH